MKRKILGFAFCFCLSIFITQVNVFVSMLYAQDKHSQEEIKELVKELDDAGAKTRKRAVEALGRLGAKEYAKDIARRLNKDRDADVKKEAVKALGMFGANEYIPDIARVLYDKNRRLKSSVIWALGELGANEYAEKIAKFLNDNDELIRGNAVIALGKLNAKGYANELNGMLNDSAKSQFFDVATNTDKDVTIGEAAAQALKKWNVNIAPALTTKQPQSVKRDSALPTKKYTPEDEFPTLGELRFSNVSSTSAITAAQLEALCGTWEAHYTSYEMAGSPLDTEKLPLLQFKIAKSAEGVTLDINGSTRALSIVGSRIKAASIPGKPDLILRIEGKEIIGEWTQDHPSLIAQIRGVKNEK